MFYKNDEKIKSIAKNVKYFNLKIDVFRKSF